MAGNESWFMVPNNTNTESYYQFFKFTNEAVEGLFFLTILLVIWIIAFVSMLFSGNFQRPSAAKAWIFASFFTTILAIPLTVLDLVAQKYMYVSIVLLGIGVVWIILEGGGT